MLKNYVDLVMSTDVFQSARKKLLILEKDGIYVLINGIKYRVAVRHHYCCLKVYPKDFVALQAIGAASFSKGSYFLTIGKEVLDIGFCTESPQTIVSQLRDETELDTKEEAMRVMKDCIKSQWIEKDSYNDISLDDFSKND